MRYEHCTLSPVRPTLTYEQTNDSKISVANDFWSSRNSVFAYGGLIGCWINDAWVLIQLPLDLLPLNGDHSGRAAGRLIFKALKRRKITQKFSTYLALTPRMKHLLTTSFLVASGADNASVNGVANHYICREIERHHKEKLKASDVQVGCAAHVLHLVVQAFLSGLGLAPDPDQEDLYEVIRGEPLVYKPEDDKMVALQTKLAEAEAAAECKTGGLPELMSVEDDGLEIVEDGKVKAVEDDESSDDDAEWEDVEDDDDSPAAKRVRKAKKKKITAVDKVCRLLYHFCSPYPRLYSFSYTSSVSMFYGPKSVTKHSDGWCASIASAKSTALYSSEVWSSGGTQHLQKLCAV